MTQKEKIFELRLLLLVSPQADKVYFNEEGDYQLFDHPEYQHEIVSREDILGIEVEETTEEVVGGDEVASTKKKRN